MFNRILLYVDERPESRAAAALALRMAKLCDARLFAVSVLAEPPEAAGSQAHKSTSAQEHKAAGAGKRRRGRGPSTEPEEQAWSRLYEIEDDAFEQDVKISLLLDNGNRDERVLALVDNYQVDALLIATQGLAGWEQLIERCPKPVVLLR